MTRESLSALYPTLTSVAAHPRLGPDLDAAIAACAVNPEQLWTNYNARAFHLNELVFTICAGPLGSFSDGSAEEMERHLKAVVAAVGLAAARTAFANKLQTANERSILDVRYEIAAARGRRDVDGRRHPQTGSTDRCSRKELGHPRMQKRGAHTH